MLSKQNAFAIIDSLELRGYFDHIIDAARIKNAKPHSDIFAIGAYVLGAAPEECVGIEDAQAGIEAIQMQALRQWASERRNRCRGRI